MTPRQQQQIPDPRAAARPVVCVLAPAWRRRHSACTCGWRGRRRLLPAVAVLDALTHARNVGCEPAIPLVYPQPRARRPGGPRS